jgi:hypothetical protein
MESGQIKILTVQAYQKPKSFSSSLAGRAEETFKAQGRTFWL